MKKIIMLAFIALGSLVISCGKDEDASLEGTWYMESITANGKVQALDECDKKSNLTFSGKNYTSTSYSSTDEGTCLEDKEESEMGTFVVSGNTITRTNSKNETDTVVFSIKGNTLTLTDNFTEGGKEYNVIVVLKKK